MADELRAEAQGFARALRGDAGELLPPPPPLPSPSPLSFADVVAHPLPGCTHPVAWAWSAHDENLACLWSQDGSLRRELFSFDPASRALTNLLAPGACVSATEAGLSAEEVLRRERARERGLGVTRFAWASASPSPRLLLADPRTNALSVWCGGQLQATGVWRAALQPSPHAAQDATLSPDGTQVAFVRHNELFVCSVSGDEGSDTSLAAPRQLTTGAGGDVTHGLAEYIAQEELSRDKGFWWRPDSGAIAFCEVDVSPVPRYTVPHYTSDPSASETHSYPFAGSRNALVRLGIVSLQSGDTVWCDLTCGGRPGGAEEYLATVCWAPPARDGSCQDGGCHDLWVALLDRDQKKLSLVAFDAATGARRRVLAVERSRTWVNASDAWQPLKDGSLLWSSEVSGFRHLYRVELPAAAAAAAGALPVWTQLTSGEWGVDSLEGVDEESGTEGRVFFTAPLPSSPLECHLFVAPLRPQTLTPPPPADGAPSVDVLSFRVSAAQPRRLTPVAGIHRVCLSHSFDRFVDTFESPDSPPSVSLRSTADGALLVQVFSPSCARAERLRLAPPRLIDVVSADGVTRLHGAVYTPSESEHGPGPYPLAVSVYGGPHVQTVTRGWAPTVDLRAQALRCRGFAVLKVDNRGSSRRGVAFEAHIHRRLGTLELNDQAAAVAHLVATGVADGTRVGIYGWSYGGYLSARAAVRMPHVFRCAVAGAPVADWRDYDTCYTERYMGHPSEDGGSHYTASSALTLPSAGGALSPLSLPPSPILIIHGTSDENVHFRHAARLAGALVAACAPHEMLLFPGAWL